MAPSVRDGYSGLGASGENRYLHNAAQRILFWGSRDAWALPEV